MIATRKLAALSLAATLVLLGAGCGSGSELGEKVAERAAEESSGGDVDIEDGTVKYTDDQGNETEFDVEGGASLPEGFPADLAPPDSVKIISANTQTVNGQKSLLVLGQAEGTVEEYYQGLKTQLTDAGYDITNDSSMSGNGADYAGISASKDDLDVTASVTNGTTDGEVSISVQVTLPKS